MLQATTPSFARSLRPTTLATALLPPRPSLSKTPRLLSSPSSLPTTRLSARMKCRWMTPRPDNCGEVTIEVSSETTAGDAAGNYTIVRTFLQLTMLETRFGHPDHHRPGHHSAGVHLRPCRLHGRVLGRNADGRRHSRGQLR